MKAKFKAGDKVVLDGKPGVIVDCVMPDALYAKLGAEPVYGVRMAPWKKVPVLTPEGDHRHSVTVQANGVATREPVYQYENPDNPGELRGHEADTIGAVAESQISRG